MRQLREQLEVAKARIRRHLELMRAAGMAIPGDKDRDKPSDGEKPWTGGPPA